MRKTLSTWGGRSTFSYGGSVAEGTTIWFGRTGRVHVSSDDYAALLAHFRHRTVDMGTSRDSRPAGSVGAWLQEEHVTRTAIASYVGPILVEEGHAERVHGDPTKIRFL